MVHGRTEKVDFGPNEVDFLLCGNCSACGFDNPLDIRYPQFGKFLQRTKQLK